MTTTTRINLDELKRRLPIEEYFRQHGSTQDPEGRWRCLCSARHMNGDSHHSVTISNGHARCWSQHCFGDKGADILQVVGVVEQLADFKSQKRRVQELAGVPLDGTRHPARQILRRFCYRDGHGREAWKLRWNTDEPGRKCTWARDPDGNAHGKGDCEPTLYLLEKVRAVPRAMLVEGERDADTVNEWLSQLRIQDLIATTTPNGAGDVKAAFLQPLHGKDQIYLTGDNDEAGQGYVRKCGALLLEHVADLRCLMVPEGVKDWTEWKERSATADDFLRLLQAAPLWTPETQTNVTPRETDAHVSRPELHADIGDLDESTRRAWDAIHIGNTPPRLFLHGSMPVRIEEDEEGRSLRLVALTPDRLRHHAAILARWTTVKSVPFTKKADWVRTECRPPMDVINNMLAAPTIPLPVLSRIVEVPVFAASGALVQQPGYDADARLFYQPYGPAMTKMSLPAEPTTEDVARAKAQIDDLLSDFPFVSEADRTHAVALAVLPFVRDVIDGPTPLHMAEAASVGTGKTLLVETVLTPSVGRQLGIIAEARDDDEWRKRFTARFRDGCPVTVIDNLSRPLDSGTVSAALTATRWEDRVLGKSETIVLPVRTIFVCTANNPVLSMEIARRSIRIRLDPQMDRPWLRNGFRHPDLRTFVEHERPAIIAALVTLVLAWMQAGRPKPAAKPLGSYESWSTIVGGIVEFAGYQHFLGNVVEFYEAADSEGTLWRLFVSSWWDAYQGRTVSVKDLFDIATSIDGFSLGRGSSERGQKTVLGQSIKKHRDQIVGRFRVQEAGTYGSGTQWRLYPVEVPVLDPIESMTLT